MKKKIMATAVALALLAGCACGKKNQQVTEEKKKRERGYLEKSVQSYLESNKKLNEAQKNIDKKQQEYKEAAGEAGEKSEQDEQQQ